MLALSAKYAWDLWKYTRLHDWEELTHTDMGIVKSIGFLSDYIANQFSLYWIVVISGLFIRLKPSYVFVNIGFLSCHTYWSASSIIWITHHIHTHECTMFMWKYSLYYT